MANSSIWDFAVFERLIYIFSEKLIIIFGNFDI